MAYLAKGNPYAMNMGVGMGPSIGLAHHHQGGGMPGLAGLAMPPSAMDPLHSAVGFPPGMERTCKYTHLIILLSFQVLFYEKIILLTSCCSII